MMQAQINGIIFNKNLNPSKKKYLKYTKEKTNAIYLWRISSLFAKY
jgi:hypothetical protein